MYAYSPDRTLIVGTREIATGTAGIVSGTFRIQNDEIEFDNNGQTDDLLDGQETVHRDGQIVFVDDNEDEWLESQIILLDHELTEEELRSDEPLVGTSLPAPDPARNIVGTYTIMEPKDGCRAADSFTPEEKARLRPIAEVLAMLDGNAFFGATTDDDGEDTWYEQYLPEAHALISTSSGWQYASFMRGDEPIPAGGILAGLVKPIEMYGEERIHDFVEDSKERQLFRLSGIEWDIDEDDTIEIDGALGHHTLTPHLPTELIVAVEAGVSGEDIDFCDRLSDRYGYCIKGLCFDSLPEDDAKSS